MGMFDDLAGNFGGIGAIAASMGLEPEQMQALLGEMSAKISGGETSVAALAEVAAAHGVSADKLQELMGQFGDPQAMMAMLGGMFEGEDNPLNKLSGLAKGLFG
ncbi:hypothetical protein WG907_02810 [Sphingobium sp. AN558]|uniref:hypothetical protein n=1 Tax=Sphingobium sp. AN558 TaxID=3133442 RepID=UPI0030C4FF8A